MFCFTMFLTRTMTDDQEVSLGLSPPEGEVGNMYMNVQCYVCTEVGSN